MHKKFVILHKQQGLWSRDSNGLVSTYLPSNLDLDCLDWLTTQAGRPVWLNGSDFSLHWLQARSRFYCHSIQKIWCELQTYWLTLGVVGAQMNHLNEILCLNDIYQSIVKQSFSQDFQQCKGACQYPGFAKNSTFPLFIGPVKQIFKHKIVIIFLSISLSICFWTVLLSNHNICFAWEIRKIIFCYTLLSEGLPYSLAPLVKRLQMTGVYIISLYDGQVINRHSNKQYRPKWDAPDPTFHLDLYWLLEKNIIWLGT